MSREEETGLLGNLPRSRPGHRSEKREAPAPGSRPARKPPTTEPSGSDPVGGALKAAANAAGAGLRIADGVTREILRRLPGR